MKPPSPTLEGFRSIFQRPTFGLAEIAWRWSFGAAAATLAVLSFFEYLDTLTVTRGDLLLLRTRQPALISEVLRHALRGSGLRFIAALIVLSLALLIGWTVIAAWARAATINALLDYLRRRSQASSSNAEEKLSRDWSLGSLLGLNLLRAGGTLAATLGFVAAVILGGMVSHTDHSAPVLALLITLAVALPVWLVWSMVNWFLSLAPIFVIRDGRDILASLAASIDLCRSHAGSVVAAGTWFGLAHVVAFFVATTIVAFPLGLAKVLPGGVTLGGVVSVTLLYFAIVDFLYVGRLAAYVAMVEFPESVAVESPDLLPPDGGRSSALSIPLTSAVDPDELILSDPTALA